MRLIIIFLNNVPIRHCVANKSDSHLFGMGILLDIVARCHLTGAKRREFSGMIHNNYYNHPIPTFPSIPYKHQ